jgi:hypothetical protein
MPDDQPQETPATGEQQAEDLGDAGKKALDEERKARKSAEKAAKAFEKQLAEMRGEFEQVRSGAMSEQEKAIDKARKEAAAEARKEVLGEANKRFVRAEIKAAAAGKLADPDDALRLLDLDDYEVDNDGNVNRQAIDKAISSLLETKPYLAARGSQPGNVPGGPQSPISQNGDADFNQQIRDTVMGRRT